MAGNNPPSYLPITDAELVQGSTGGSLADSWGVDMSGFNPAGTGGKKKQGTYTQTQISATIPNDLAIENNINNIFQQYYGRDANRDELAIWLPELKKQYTGKNGKQKQIIKTTYDSAGNLIQTDYLTADGSDPKLWLEKKVKNQLLSGQQELTSSKIPEGPSGKYFTAFKNFAANNGIMLSDTAAADFANKVVAGAVDQNTILSTIRDSAANAFPAQAEKIKQGLDLKTLADPYMQSMSRILEIPDTAIDLFDPKIRSAMAYTLPDGKIGTKSIYDFEKELRQDSRWQYTNNARAEVSNSVAGVLKDFGFMG